MGIIEECDMQNSNKALASIVSNLLS